MIIKKVSCLNFYLQVQHDTIPQLSVFVDFSSEISRSQKAIEVGMFRRKTGGP